MKYIRTKKGIYEPKTKMMFNHIKEYKEANTIEELCDEFVLVEKMREATYYHRSSNFNDFKSIAMLNERYTLYGAIWIEIKLPDGKSVFRLEPQAIMDKGDLKLI